jgi:hypothetical protein
MENRKPKSSGFSGAPPPRGITGPGTTSVASPRAMSSAPQPRGTSGSERPPRSIPPLTAKPRRRPVVVPAPQHTEGAPVPGQDVSSLGGSLTRWVLPAPPWSLLSLPLLPPSSCLHVTHTHQTSLICSCHCATTPRPRHWTTMPPGTLGSTLRQHFH